MEAMEDDEDDRACFLLSLLTRKRLPRNTADITPAIDEPAMTAISVDIIWVCQGLLEEKLSVVYQMTCRLIQSYLRILGSG
jgi:hypothetical protein